MLKQQLCNKKGETLIIVVIIAVILLIVGGAMMGFAANNMHATSQNAMSKDAYNISKSTGKVISQSMEGGKLGKLLRNTARKDFINNCDPTVGATYSKEWELVPTITFSDERLQNYTVKDMKISFTSQGTVTTVTGTIITGCSFTMENMKVRYTVEDAQGNSYKITQHYNYTGWYSKSGVTITWSNEVWKTIKSTN